MLRDYSVGRRGSSGLGSPAPLSVSRLLSALPRIVLQPRVSLSAMADVNPGEVEDDARPSLIRELDDCGAVFFATRVESATDLHRIEIPKKFTAATGWPGILDVRLLTSMTGSKVWPLQLKRFEPGSRMTAFSIGRGWAEFVADNNISIGDLLAFEPADDCTLAVQIERHREPKAKAPKKTTSDSPVEAAATSAPAGAPAKLWVPTFCKTLRASHTNKGTGSRLDIPTLYWRTYGTDQFDDHFFTLAGPIAEMPVKASLCVTAKQTFCFFTSGWYNFYKKNELKLGDTLLFSKTGPASFEVSVKIPGSHLFV